MPRYYRIAKDTGIKEYDDSCEPFEGICPQCKSKHKGHWDICDDCHDYNNEQYELERQAYRDYLEDIEGEGN